MLTGPTKFVDRHLQIVATNNNALDALTQPSCCRYFCCVAGVNFFEWYQSRKVPFCCANKNYF